ncbi:hypothetical protein CF165_46510 [Amycolatopsis vastitatis]|uniref:Uncharacterized protein n=1 Tax=Amycolatopsis vastitatis TaxID=1905142 RepID=A0A229SLC0_9PSEU|nr:hypothetical protein CF165_46510 [Amycolatopsis vastitatis]
MNGGDRAPQDPGLGDNNSDLVIVCDPVIAGLTSLYVTTQSVAVVAIAAGLVVVLALVVAYTRRR